MSLKGKIMMIFRIPSALLDLASAGYVVGFDQLKLDGVDASQGTGIYLIHKGC